MEKNILILNYGIDSKGNATRFNGMDAKGQMEINLDNTFTTYKTGKEIEKCYQVRERRKVIKLILQVGHDENVKQFHEWCKMNSKLWLKELEKLMDRRW